MYVYNYTISNKHECYLVLYMKPDNNTNTLQNDIRIYVPYKTLYVKLRQF